MKKIGYIVLAILLLLLNFAALDDITTGNEPDYIGEYAIVVSSMLIVGSLLYRKLVARR